MIHRACRAACYAVALVGLVLVVEPANAATTRAKPDPGLRVVQIASRLTGTPYRWGGASPRTGFDCSGLVQYVYGRIGIELPHRAASQYGYGRHVARSALRPGDLVFFSGLNHVGIYAGGDKFIHAPQRGTTVRWSRLSSRRSFYGAVRLLAA